MGNPRGMMPGREKNKPIASESDGQLSYWINRIQQELADGTTPERFAAGEQAKLKELQEEVVRRKGGGKREAAPASSPTAGSTATALMTKAEADALAGSFADSAHAMEVMRKAASMAFLVTSQTSVPQLPHGCQMAFSVVWIDADTETYGIPTKDSEDRGLDKNALNKIAAAYGVSWDPYLTRRLDSGREPYYVHYTAVARLRNFDGSERIETGTVEIDLRDNSQDALDACATADAKDKSANGDYKKMARRTANGVPFDLANARKFILRNAESKAKNRAIRCLGIRTKYKRAELDSKPFVVASVMFTGRSDNPEMEARFADKIADAHLGSRTALYGGSARALPPGAAPPALPAAHDPPPVGSSPGDPDDDDWRRYDDDREDRAASNGSAPATVVPTSSVPGAAVPTQGSADKQGSLLDT